MGSRTSSTRSQLIFFSLVLGGLLQWQWALTHSYQYFLLRWFGAALVLFLFVFSIHKLLARWFGQAVARRFQRSALIFSFTPVALLLQNNFAIAVGMLLIVSVSLVVLLDLTATRWKATISGLIVASLLAVLVLTIEIEFDGVSIKWERPEQDTFIAMFGVDANGVNWEQHSGSFEFAGNGLVSSRFGLGRIETNSDRLGVRFWAHVEDVNINNASFDSYFLFWNFPLLKLNGNDLIDYLVLSNTRVTRNGFLANVTPVKRGPRSWIYLQFDSSTQQQLYSAMQPGRPLVLRAAWWLVSVTVFTAMLALIRSHADWSSMPRYWSRLFVHTEIFDRADYKISSIHHRKWIFLGIALLVILVFLRSWEGLTTDALFMEDAALHFNKYYAGEKPFYSIFDRPNGYVAFITNLQAWLYAKLDVMWQPDLYRYSGILLALIAGSYLGFSGLFNQPVMLLAVPGVLGLSGLNHIFFWNTITYQIFTAVVLLICLLFLPPPATRLRLILRLTLIAVLVWSGPYSVIAVGVAVLLLLFRVYPGSISIYLWTIFCAISYFIAFDGSAVQPFALFNTLHRAPHLFAVLFEKVLLLDLFGEMSLAKGMIPLIVISVLLWNLRSDRRYIKISLTIFAIMLSSLLLYFVTVKYDRFVVQENHILLSYYFWLVFLLLSIDRILTKYRISRYIQAVVMAGLALFVWKDNQLHTNKHYWPKMDELPGFMRAVGYFEGEQHALEKEGRYVVLTAPPRWPPLPGPTATVGGRENGMRLRRQDIDDPALKQFVSP